MLTYADVCVGGCRFVFVEPGTLLPQDPATRLPPAESADEKKKAEEERARLAAEEKALEEEERKRAEEVADEAAKAAVMALSEELQSETYSDVC
jgi:small-conductance mechanosensitive channel